MYETIRQNKGLSIERLLVLCEVAKAGGIKAAVGDDPIRQSLASRQLKELGNYAGKALCRKVGRTLEMTDAGKQLAEIGCSFFGAIEAFLLTMRDLPSRFRLGIGDSLFQWQLLPKMKSFETCFPKVQLVPFSYSANEIIRNVKDQILDAGIVRQSAVPNEGDLIVKTIGEIKYRLFIPTSFVRNARKQILPDMRDIPFCTLTGDGEYVHAMSTFLTAFNGHPALNCSSMTQIYAAVQSGQYAAVLPANAIAGMSPTSTKVYTLPELTPFTRQIALIYKADARTSKDKSSILDFLSHSVTNEQT